MPDHTSAVKPTIFMGSSMAASGGIEVFQKALDDIVEVVPWTRAFKLGKAAFDELWRFTETCDFALFLLAPDDLIKVGTSDREIPTARDNVIFELGLFLGRLGNERTLYTCPAGDFRLPSDLFGIVHLGYYDPSIANTDSEKFASVIKGVRDQVAAHGAMRRTEALKAAQRSISDLKKALHASSPAPIDAWSEWVVADLAAELCRESQLILGSKRYHSELGVEQNFLIRAKQMFSLAREVRAVSVDAYSTFWVRDAQWSLAEAYIGIQPQHTTRLFVFSNVMAAHRHRLIMHLHFERYGRTGMVAFTSLKHYHALLKECFRESHLEMLKRIANSDFAVLTYDSPNGESVWEARLDSSALSCNALDPSSTDRTGYDQFFSRLKEITGSNSSNDLGRRFVRWKLGMGKNNEEWAAALKKVFSVGPEDRREEDTDPRHIVLFKNVASPAKLAQAISLLEKATHTMFDDDERPFVRGFWFGRHTKLVSEMYVQDAVSSSRLITTNDIIKQYEYCLIVRFDSTDDLKKYYSHASHSRLRRLVYEACSERIAPHFEKMEREKDATKRREIYDRIERLMQRHLVRLDYVRDDDIDVITTYHSLNPD